MTLIASDPRAVTPAASVAAPPQLALREQTPPSDSSAAADDRTPDDLSREWSFWDFLDVVNPLQHLPVVSTLYRAATGDEISAPARLAGGALYGGPVGLVSAGINEIIEAETGKDVGDHVLTAFAGEDPFGTATPVEGGSELASIEWNQPDSAAAQAIAARPYPGTTNRAAPAATQAEIGVSTLDAPVFETTAETDTPVQLAAASTYTVPAGYRPYPGTGSAVASRTPANVAATETEAATPVSPPLVALGPGKSPYNPLPDSAAETVAESAASAETQTTAVAAAPVLPQMTEAGMAAVQQAAAAQGIRQSSHPFLNLGPSARTGPGTGMMSGFNRPTASPTQAAGPVSPSLQSISPVAVSQAEAQAEAAQSASFDRTAAMPQPQTSAAASTAAPVSAAASAGRGTGATGSLSLSGLPTVDDAAFFDPQSLAILNQMGGMTNQTQVSAAPGQSYAVR